MQFVHQWFPLIVTIRERGFDSLELDELSAGFERYFQRGEPYAVLNTSLLAARAPDAVGRMRLAEWANQPRVRSCSKDLCAGSATVVARSWERHALTALQWLWSPLTPHQAVQHVRDGIAICVERLTERQVQLPSRPELFRNDVYRTLTGLQVAGLDGAPGSRAATSAAPGAAALQTIADRDGSIVLGWLAPGVLWGRFIGRLNESVCQAYTSQLGQHVEDSTEVRYFVDGSALQSIELSARSAALRALFDQERHFAAVIVSNWAGGISPAGRATLQALGSTIQIVQDPRDFETRLLQAAPRAREIIDGAGLLNDLRPSPH